MGTPVRISIIGAGSAQFSLAVIRDICLTNDLAGSTICLMDIDQSRVEMVRQLATRYVAELGANLKFEQTVRREDALRGSDFVINTASTGAHGGGGYENFHNIRFFVDVARDMEKLCPDSWLIQSGNPVFEGCTAMTRETSVKIVGLCHGHSCLNEMCRVLGLDFKKLSWQAPGFNHIIYLTHCYYEGKNVYPMLDEWIEKHSEEYWRTYKPAFYENQMSRGAIQQYKLVGYLPVGDTPRWGGWWLDVDLPTRKHWFGPIGGFDSQEGWAMYIAELETKRRRMFEVAADPKAEVLKEFPPIKSGEQIVPLIDALANDNAGLFQVNIPNNNLIFDLPADVVVEVPAWISKRGIQGIQVGKMPVNIMTEILWPQMAVSERRVNLALHPNKALLLDTILQSRQLRTFDEGVQRMNQILRDDPELARLMQ